MDVTVDHHQAGSHLLILKIDEYNHLIQNTLLMLGSQIIEQLGDRERCQQWAAEAAGGDGKRGGRTRAASGGYERGGQTRAASGVGEQRAWAERGLGALSKLVWRAKLA